MLIKPITPYQYCHCRRLFSLIDLPVDCRYLSQPRADLTQSFSSPSWPTPPQVNWAVYVLRVSLSKIKLELFSERVFKYCSF